MNVVILDANRTGSGVPRKARSNEPEPANPKWRVVKAMADELEADLAWRSPKTSHEPPLGGYDVLVFNRVMPDVKDNAAWLEANPDATIFHITNDYLVGGGPMYLPAKMLKRQVHVIANYPRPLSKFASHLADTWTEVNLNALLYEPDRTKPNNIRRGARCVYYGAWRPERLATCQKYLTGHVDLALRDGFRQFFEAAGWTGPFVPEVDWRGEGLYRWHSSLYLWNFEVNGQYRFLTNRFYEALSYDLYPIFPEEARWVFERSGYPIPPELVVHHADEIPQANTYENTELMQAWRHQAADERDSVLETIRRTIRGN